MRPLLGGLQPRLFASVILPFTVVLLALAVAGIEIHGRAMRSLVADRDERAARAAAVAISGELIHRELAVRDIALRLADGVAAARVIGEAGAFAPDFPEGIAIVSAEGRIGAGSLPPESSGSPILSEALATQHAEVLLRPLMSGERTILLVIYSSRPLSVVGAFAAQDLLRAALPGMEAPPARASAVIVDPAAGVLALVGVPPLESDYRNHPGVRAALQGTTGSSYVTSPGGDEHVVAFSPIRSAGWTLLIEEPWQSVASPLLRLSLVAPLALAPVLLISLVGLWFAARQVVGPLRNLERLAIKLAAGDFEAVQMKLRGVREIRELQRSMTTMARRLQSAQQALRRYVGKVTSAQEEERRRLAQDLHDETIQDLIALDQKVQLAARSLRASRSAKADDLEAVHRDAKEVIQRVRRLSLALRPAYLEDLGLLPALEALATDAGSSMGVPVLLRIVGRQRRLSRDIDLALYRIVQEALANIARHAAAHHAWITLRFGREALQVDVRDDGAGFVPPLDAGDMTRAGHFGLIGMRERAQLIGARLELRSAPGKGTRVALRLALPSRPKPRPP